MTSRHLVCGVLALGAILVSAAARADTLVVCTEASPDFLNAALSGANTSFDVTEQTSDRLVETEIGGSVLKPALAESWTISPDGLRYTFKLRHGVKWQSNTAFKPTRDFDAEDVVFTFNRMLDRNGAWHKVGGGSFEMFDSFVAPALQSVRKVDDETVEFVLKAPSAPLLNTLSIQSLSISSAEYAAAMQKAGTPEQLDRVPIGTGPFQFVQYQPDSLIRFRAFPDFWGAKGGMAERAPKVDTLVFSISKDPAVRLAKLRANECQIARYPNAADVPTIRTLPGLVLQEATIASDSHLALRTDRKPFDDVRVRRAMAAATNVPSLVQAVWQGSGTPAGGLVPTSLWGNDPTIGPVAYDPKAARALLAEAGYPNGFSTDIMVIPVTRAYMPDGRRAGEMIQADWAAVGVTVKLVSYEWGEFLRRRRAGEGSVVMTGGTWDYPDPSQQLIPLTCGAIAGGRNVSDWCNHDFDELVAKGGVVTDQAERARLYRQAQEVIHDQVPLVQFADSKAYVALRDNVRGLRLHFLGGQPFGGVSLVP